MNQIEIDDRQVVIFYHVHAVNDWERIVNSQISAICISGLYQRADKIYVCINKPQHWHINLPKFIVLSNPTESLENHSLQKMHDFSIHNDCHLLYIHTKGVTRTHITPDFSFARTDQWRQYLDYILIHQWQQCLDLLQTHDCVGTEWDYIKVIYPHTHLDSYFYNDKLGFYSGNFFWTSSQYFASLDPQWLWNIELVYKKLGIEMPQENEPLVMTLRMQGEYFLGLNQPKFYNFMNLNPNKFTYVRDWPLSYINKVTQPDMKPNMIQNIRYV